MRLVGLENGVISARSLPTARTIHRSPSIAQSRHELAYRRPGAQLGKVERLPLHPGEDVALPA